MNNGQPTPTTTDAGIPGKQPARDWGPPRVAPCRSSSRAVEWDRDVQRRPGAGWTHDPHSPAKVLDRLSEADEPTRWRVSHSPVDVSP
jgi:hypothetical protein